MKIGEVSKSVLNPPSVPEAIQIPTKKMETTNPSANNNEHIAKFLEVFSKQNQKAIKNLFEHINEFAKDNQISLKFIPEKESGMVIVKVYDGQGKLIRQIPPEEVLALSAEFAKNKGFLLNKRM